MFWVILAVGAGLRLGLVAAYPYIETRGDQTFHYVLGALLPHFGHGVLGHWAPGYKTMLSSVFAIFGADPAAAKFVQALISTGSIPLVYAIAKEHPGVLLSHWVHRVYYFWGPNSYLLSFVERGVYPDGPLQKAPTPS